MNIKKLLVFGTIAGLFLTGCTAEKMKEDEKLKGKDKQVNSQQTAEKGPLATKDFIKKTFQLTEEEVDNYEVEDLISYYQLTEEYFLEEKHNLKNLSSITIVLKFLQKQMRKAKEENENEYDYDFTYLLKGEEVKGDLPDMETIQYLTVSDQTGTGGTSFLIDFDENMIYDSYYSAGLYSDIRKADKETALSEKQKADIIKALQDAKIWKWKSMYSSKSDVGLESWWHLGVEFEDGTIVSFSGAGKVPDNYNTLEEVLYKR